MPVPAMFKSVPQPIALTVNCSAALGTHVLSGKLEDEIALANKHVTALSSLAPVGSAAARREPAEIKALAQEKGCGHPVMFSGTFNMLDMYAVAVPNTIDAGRIAFVCEQLTHVHSLSEELGTIQINTSQWTADEATGLVRVHKDAEVTAVALCLYWHRDADSKLTKAMWESLADLVFDARAFGTGSEFRINKFSIIGKEESVRKVLGLSAARTCIYLIDTAAELIAEGLHADQNDESSKLRKLFESAKGKFSVEWNLDTLRRYLSIGRRLNNPRLRALIMLWEYMHKRDALIDSIGVLRAAVGAATSDNDLYNLFQTLYLEQRAGIRHVLTNSTRSKNAPSLPALMRAILLRGQLYVHLEHTFPHLAEFVKPFTDNTSFGTLFGIDLYGKLDPKWTPSLDDDDDDELDINSLKQKGGASVYESKCPLLRLLKNLANNAYEKTFTGIAIESKKDLAIAQLNLAMPCAIRLKTVIANLQVIYQKDFPDKPEPTSTTAVVHQLKNADSGDAQLTVTLEHCIETEEEYKSVLAEWQNLATKIEEDVLNEFLDTRLQFVIAPGADHVERAKRVKAPIPSRISLCIPLGGQAGLASSGLTWEGSRGRGEVLGSPWVVLGFSTRGCSPNASCQQHNNFKLK